MDKWITLHYTESDNISKELLVNFGLRIEMYMVCEQTMVVPFTARAYNESPAEIIALLTQPDTELRQAARELMELVIRYPNSNLGVNALVQQAHKLEALLEKP